MQASRNEYDRGVNTFSPEGRLFQVEYALGAVKLGSTTIAVCTDSGVVVCAEKRLISPLIDDTQGDLVKILKVDDHLIASSAGVIGDARLLIDKSRVLAANHFFTYNEKTPVESIGNSLAEYMMNFSGFQGDIQVSRPFGAAIVLAGVDPQRGPELWCVDPSGSCNKYTAVAVGSAHEGSTQTLQEKYTSSMSFEDAEVLALYTLRQGMEEKLSSSNVEMGCVRIDQKGAHYSPQEIQEVIDRLPASGAAERLMADTLAS